MGLCKCRNITDLYCFVHKKPVCQFCICPEHTTCVIGTYVEWLQDPDYEPPVCSICKDGISEDNVLRLMCLHLFHPECIDVHASSFPPHTAHAGFTCPTCSKPIIPPPGTTSPLAKLLQQHLQTAPWLNPVKEKESEPKYSDGSKSRTEVEIDIPIGSEGGIAARKTKTGTLRGDIESNGGDTFDDDDDKYHKHSMSQMLQGLLKEEPGLPAGKKKSTPFRLTSRKMLMLFGLLSILCTIIFLHRSLSAMGS